MQEILFLLLRTRVDIWKYEVFLSPIMTQSVLAFIAQISSSIWRIRLYSSVSWFWRLSKKGFGLTAKAFWVPNILAIMHHTKQKRKAKKGYITLKLEQRHMIEWEWLFVGNIMKRIGFQTTWIKLINGRSHWTFVIHIKKQSQRVLSNHLGDH